MHAKAVFVLVLNMFLSACTGLGISLRVEQYPEFDNSELVLLKPLTIPANHASVKIQHGKLSQGRQLDKYFANCNFELKNISTSATVVQPEAFKIYKIKRDENYVLSEFVLYASVDADMGGDALAIEYSTEFYLTSPDQPRVFRMTCSHWENPSFPEHLTVSQINSTLSPWFEIRSAKQ